MRESQRPRVRDPTTSVGSSSRTTRPEGEESNPFSRRRSLSEGRLHAGQEMEEAEEFSVPSGEQRQSESTAKKETRAEVIRLNNVISEIQYSLEACTVENGRKDDVIRTLESYLAEEQNRKEEAAVHYTTLLEDKDLQIYNLRRGFEAREVRLIHQLEEHSKVGQNLAQILETERRDWQMEKDNLQSERDGTRQLLHEQQHETARNNQKAQEALERSRRQEEELESLTSKYEALLAEKHEDEGGFTIREAEFNAKVEEISELRSRLSKVNELIEENFQRTDSELKELRLRLADALEQRDRVVAELHATKDKDYGRKTTGGSNDSSSSSSSHIQSNQSVHFTQLQTQLEEVKFELEEERAISQATQAKLEDQLRVNRQLETDNKNLKNNLDIVRPRASTSQQFAMDAAATLQQNLIQLRETLRSAQSQAAGIVAKRRTSHSLHHASSLNISLQEAQHQVDSIISLVEDGLGITSKLEDVSESKESSKHRRLFSFDKRLKSLFKAGSHSFGSGSRKNKGDSSQKLKLEIEDLRKELLALVQENFTLEQCVRYLGARCQLYQTMWLTREGRHHRSTTERLLHSHSSKRPFLPRSRAGRSMSGEIQVDPLESNRESVDEGPSEVRSTEKLEEREGSSSSSSGKTQSLEIAPSMSRNLELRLLSKISSICEPFSQFTDSSLLLPGLHASQTASISG